MSNVDNNVLSCDACQREHDVVKDHCDIGEHCTSTTAICAADYRNDDHLNECCDCSDTLDNRLES